MISARLFFFHQVAANRFDQGGREEEGGLDLTTWQSEHCTPAIIWATSLGRFRSTTLWIRQW